MIEFWKQVQHCVTAKRSSIMVSAGMPRSGSTWLFNAARLLLQQHHGDTKVSSGWIGDRAALPKRPIVLLKIHEYDRAVARSAKVVSYSYRDLRDALASSRRKFGIEPTVEEARNWIESDRQWRNNANYVMRYETMIEKPKCTLQELAAVFGVTDFDLNSIVRQLRQLALTDGGLNGMPYHQETLLHPRHITDGRHGTWHEWLSPEFLQCIEREFAEWFEENDYPVAKLQ